MQPGEWVEIVGDNREANGFLGRFSMTGTIAASNSIMYMIYGENMTDEEELIMPYSAFGLFMPQMGQFNGIFNNCSSLINPPLLPATSLTDYCYFQMFYGCTDLTSTPLLPATALTDYCYYQMFCGCTNITEVNEILATTLGTSSLSEMLKDCINITEIPELLPNVLNENSYTSLFENCTNLNSITINFIQWNYGQTSSLGTSNWLRGVSPTGTFRCPRSLDTSIRDSSHVPEGWTIEYID